ncbi:very long chain fatty acid elongase 6-like [Morus bassanus]
MELSFHSLELQPLGEYDFERKFNDQEAREWMWENCRQGFSSPALLTVRAQVYFLLWLMILIFGIQHFMKEWRGYKLRVPLTLWSLNLALFRKKPLLKLETATWQVLLLSASSSSGSRRCNEGAFFAAQTLAAAIFQELLHGASAIGAHWIWKQMVFILSTKGFKQSVCSQSFCIHSISKFWVYLFVLSKILELGDTVFIVLHKKKLMFLHWYHHITTLIITRYPASSPWQSPFHMLQMLAYITLNVLIIFWMEDKVCHTTWTTVFLSSMLYLSFLVFFCNFFSKNYLRSTQKSKGE